MPNANYNDGCLESVQCQQKLGEGAVCELGKCVCGEDFTKVTLNVTEETISLCENRICKHHVSIIQELRLAVIKKLFFKTFQLLLKCVHTTLIVSTLVTMVPYNQWFVYRKNVNVQRTTNRIVINGFVSSQVSNQYFRMKL